MRTVRAEDVRLERQGASNYTRMSAKKILTEPSGEHPRMLSTDVMDGEIKSKTLSRV